MEYIKFKTFLGEETVSLSDLLDNKETLNEELSNTEINKIKNQILDDDKLTKKVEDLLKKELKGTDFENKVTEIAKNCIIQLFKQLWIKRSSWAIGITNKSS